MSREIKFRAWDKRTKVMRHWPWCIWVDLGGFIWATPKKCYQTPNHECEVNLDGKFILMQYTGLKDKDGAGEVYDGDVCLIRVDFSQPDADKSDCRNLKVHIFYDDELFSWCWAWKEKTGHGQLTCQFNEHEFDVLKVIGNIHQNPELLS